MKASDSKIKDNVIFIDSTQGSDLAERTHNADGFHLSLNGKNLLLLDFNKIRVTDTQIIETLPEVK